MLRWMTPFLVAIFAIGTAAADGPEANKTTDGPAATKPADSRPPPSPRSSRPPAPSPRSAPVTPPQPGAPQSEPPASYRRACLAPTINTGPRLTAAAPLYVRRGRALVVEEEVDLRFSPVNVAPYAPRLFGTPLLPGS